MRKSWSVLYLLVAAVAGALPAIWAFFSHQVAYGFTFPNNTTDAVVHIVIAAVMIAVATYKSPLTAVSETRAPVSLKRRAVVRPGSTDFRRGERIPATQAGPAFW
jgi:hypothetical protein